MSEVTENAVWLNPTDKYIWVEDVMYYLNDGTTREVDLRLDLSHMQKISKSKYRLSYELTAQRARLEDEDRDKFETQTLEFEINLNANREVQYIF